MGLYATTMTAARPFCRHHAAMASHYGYWRVGWRLVHPCDRCGPAMDTSYAARIAPLQALSMPGKAGLRGAYLVLELQSGVLAVLTWLAPYTETRDGTIRARIAARALTVAQLPAGSAYQPWSTGERSPAADGTRAWYRHRRAGAWRCCPAGALALDHGARIGHRRAVYATLWLRSRLRKTCRKVRKLTAMPSAWDIARQCGSVRSDGLAA